MTDRDQAPISRRSTFHERFMIVLTLSLIGHLAFLGLILFSGSVWPNKNKTIPSYQVNLVSLSKDLQQKLPSLRDSLPPPPKEKSVPPVEKSKPKPKPKESVPSPDLKKKAKPQEKPSEKPQQQTTESAPSKEEQKPAANENFSMGAAKDGTARSGSMKVDAAFFPFGYYLEIIRDKIARNWFPPFGVVTVGESRSLVVHFRIDESGKILKAEIEESSGDSLLDQSSLRAVLVSNPFPPLPFGFSDKDLGIHFRFECFR